MRQVAALPYRIEEDGAVRVLLITSRETRRWVVPKGNPIRGLAPHEAAAHEAFEEAGVRGITCPAALGSYHYEKRKRGGSLKTATVALYPVAVVEQAQDWPEQDERETRWFDLPAAADAVEEPELKELIGGFRAPKPVTGRLARAISWLRIEGGERFAMLRWFQALMPKQGLFFELFEHHAATLVAGADALALLLQGGSGMSAHARTIHDREHDADEITRTVLQDARRTLITPFDRTAISGLIGAMDDAIDQMNSTANTVTLYEQTEFSPQMRDMAGIIVEAARITVEVMPLLRSIGDHSTRILELTGRLVTIEGTADDIHNAGIKAAYQANAGSDGAGSDPLKFIVQREIYRSLEQVVDRFEDMANEIQGLVLDHA